MLVRGRGSLAVEESIAVGSMTKLNTTIKNFISQIKRAPIFHMLQLQVACAYRRLPRCILLCQQRFISEESKPSRAPSKYKSDLKSLITTFKKELGAVQTKEEKETIQRKVEEQKVIQKMLELNKLENKKIAIQR